jgi:hypothetical protein
MRVSFTKVGAEYTSGREDQISQAVQRAQWHPIPYKMSFSGGEGLKAAIKEFRIPKVSHAADYYDFVSGIPHPEGEFGLLGVRGHYTNGVVDVIFVDFGIGLCPVCMIEHETQLSSNPWLSNSRKGDTP